MFQDFSGLCPFILQVFGICDHQDEFAKQTSIMLATDVQSISKRFFTAIEALGVSLFFGLLFTKNQDVSINPISQWHSIIFCLTIFLTPFVTKNVLGIQLSKLFVKYDSQLETNTKNLEAQDIDAKSQYQIKNYSTQNNIIILQCQLTQSSFEYHKSLLNVRGDYQHELDYYQEFLSGFIFNGYGIIPGFGIILATIAKYMNSIGLATNGEKISLKTCKQCGIVSIKIIFELFLVMFLIGGITLALCSDEEGVYLGFIITFIILYYISFGWSGSISKISYLQKCFQFGKRKLIVQAVNVI
ncbi:Hypothetical_protein [Hexamita inflata]|uniref:Hypothetical_protein n=1 Tax=Hexamita inflata TaxID=28002 RepID=A0AA86UTL1_9EUKA|nr:Hypothetical protein HINF_LOCUS55064 [Hexamita inflata]